MKSVKVRGLMELHQLRRRVNNAHGLDRISRLDRDYIVSRLDEVEARIIAMRETNEQGEEEG